MIPRALWYVWATAIIRSGGHVGIGQFDTKWLPKEELARIREIGDIEMEIEEMRREVAPDAASRLGCLYVGENSPQGAANIRKWFDLYCQNRKSEYLRNYWTSRPFGTIESWEYLADGVVESQDKSDLAFIKLNRTRIF
jgi:hypothetical protein